MMFSGFQIRNMSQAWLTLELTDSFELPPREAFSVHNQLVIGYRLYNAWYQGGLQVFDIDPATGLLESAAVYDAPDSFWGVYPSWARAGSFSPKGATG